MTYGSGTNFFGFDDVTSFLIFDHDEIVIVHKLICFVVVFGGFFVFFFFFFFFFWFFVLFFFVCFFFVLFFFFRHIRLVAHSIICFCHGI